MFDARRPGARRAAAHVRPVGQPDVARQPLPVADLPAGVGVGLVRRSRRARAPRGRSLRAAPPARGRCAIRARACRPGSRSRSRTKASQSRTARPHHVVDGGDVGRPGLPLLRQRAPAFGRQPVEAALALAGLLDPAALDQAAVLEPQQGRVERRQREGQPPAGSRLDQLADLVAVPRPRLRAATASSISVLPFFSSALNMVDASPICSDA